MRPRATIIRQMQTAAFSCLLAIVSLPALAIAPVSVVNEDFNGDFLSDLPRFITPENTAWQGGFDPYRTQNLVGVAPNVDWEDGQLRPNAGALGGVGEPADNWIVSGEALRDVSIRTEFHAGDNDAYGVVFAFENPDNFWLFYSTNDKGVNAAGEVVSGDARSVLIRVKNGAAISEWGSTLEPIRENARNSIVINVRNGRVRAHVNGSLIMSVSAPSGTIMPGKVGLYSFAVGDCQVTRRNRNLHTIPNFDPDIHETNVRELICPSVDNGSLSKFYFIRQTSLDVDGDGLKESEELALGLDRDLVDSDGDLIADGVEVGEGNFGGSNLTPFDTDGDGTIDALDLESDGDCITDAYEVGPVPIFPLDSDGDGIFDFQDIDSNNDLIEDGNQLSIEFGGSCAHPGDCDGDNHPDYRDISSDICFATSDDGAVTTTTNPVSSTNDTFDVEFSGGGGCGALPMQSAENAKGAVIMLMFVTLAWIGRRFRFGQ